eukprot:3253934-Amphidinium_carterae.1
MAVLSTCAFHCQMCTEHAVSSELLQQPWARQRTEEGKVFRLQASTAHEQAIFVQENGLQGLCTQALPC